MANKEAMKMEFQKLKNEINEFESPDLLREAGVRNFNICLFRRQGKESQVCWVVFILLWVIIAILISNTS